MLLVGRAGHYDNAPIRFILIVATIIPCYFEIQYIGLAYASIVEIYGVVGKVKTDVEDPRNRFYTGPKGNGKKKLTVISMAKILRPYFMPEGTLNRIRAASTFIVLIASKACNIISPIYIGLATQELVSKQVIPWGNLAVYCSTKFASVALRELQKVIYLGVKQQAFQEISFLTFTHLHKLSLDWHLKKKIGHVLRIMDRGIASADQVMNYLFLYLIPSVIECIVTFVIFYFRFQSPQLAVIGFISFYFYTVTTVQITLWRKKFRKRQNTSDNKYHDIATDSLINFETVKYFAAENMEAKRFNTAIKSFQKSKVLTQASLGFLNTLQQFDIQLTTFFGLGVMAAQILSVKDVSPANRVGEFVSVNAYILQLFAPLSYLGTIYAAVVQAFIDMTNLSELLDVTPDVDDVPNANNLRVKAEEVGAKVEFRNVTFKYPSEDSRGIEDVSFVCEPGTKTAIVGHTGAGKTTISRLLYRFYDIESGGIYIDDQNISHVTQNSLRNVLGVVPQDCVLFNESIKYNIMYGSEGATEEMLTKAAKASQIYDFIMSLEKKWDTQVGERGLKLSGGEKQRVAIARCLLRNPPVVVLDEATSALDSVTEKSVQLALENLAQGRTQLVIAHRLSTIQDADQILVLADGKIIEKGTHEELIKLENGEYAKSWQVQLEDGEKNKYISNKAVSDSAATDVDVQI